MYIHKGSPCIIIIICIDKRDFLNKTKQVMSTFSILSKYIIAHISININFCSESCSFSIGREHFAEQDLEVEDIEQTIQPSLIQDAVSFLILSVSYW